MTSRVVRRPRIGPALYRFVVGLILACVVSDAATASDGVIDALLADAHRSESISPQQRCDDATFLRRLSLDLIGRVPNEDEWSSFLASPDRQSAVERLLASPEHAVFWSHLWTSMLVGRGEQRYIEREVLRSWLQDQLESRTPLNELAYKLITARGVTALNGPVNFVAASRSDPVMRLSRTFLSVQLDCAQCHDHPYDRWTNDDYESMQRFYALTRFREVSGGVAVSDDGAPENAARPTFLTGRQPHTSAWRRELGVMVVTSKPFSRAMVNRTWHWLMGRGIIDPVDGLSEENPASVPELLEVLAADLRETGFDLTTLVRRICLSDAYQRSTLAAEDAADQPGERMQALFAVRTPRMLLPEQWLASIAIVLDQSMPAPGELAEQASRWSGVTGQSMPARDPFVWSATSQTLIRQLAGDLPAAIRSPDSLFQVTLGRAPSEAERRLVAAHDGRELVFALVHGNEFMTND